MRVSRWLGALWSRGCCSCLFPLPFFFCLRGGIGRHTTLKMWRSWERVGSSPTGGTSGPRQCGMALTMPVWWNGRHARLKSGCPVGRAGSSPATGTGGNKTVEYGARVRVLWPTLGRVALWLVPPVGRWCPTFGGWCAGSCCAPRVLDGCFVSPFWTVIQRGCWVRLLIGSLT